MKNEKVFWKKKKYIFCFWLKIEISYSAPSFTSSQFPWENPYNFEKPLHPILVKTVLKEAA